MRQAGTYSGILSSGSRIGPHSLPLARIKKIMKKSGDDVKMISGEAPIVFSKACELFIEDLTQRSWMVAMQGKKRTLHKEDVISAVVATDVFDFLVNLVSNSSHSMCNLEGRDHGIIDLSSLASPPPPPGKHNMNNCLMEEVDAPSPRPINSVVDSFGASGAVTPGTEGGAMDVDQPSPRLLMSPPPPPATAANKA
ncbi:hypothetical protein Tsubulata_008450 [Turnera subulata]|uniref:Transcription factor CBF/NF-Y/archaeal histone domain-containing protein n=1 Tax=Turnera subulata TaxID=218843 RepID=A0A9Q0JD07_9ROSI|nr:hypothetical protein Tsubulata_008450 [Turnera subulata]